jgi:hypothetical protein
LAGKKTYTCARTHTCFARWSHLFMLWYNRLEKWVVSCLWRCVSPGECRVRYGKSCHTSFWYIVFWLPSQRVREGFGWHCQNVDCSALNNQANLARIFR